MGDKRKLTFQGRQRQRAFLGSTGDSTITVIGLQHIKVVGDNETVIFSIQKRKIAKNLLDKAKLMVAFLGYGKEADQNFWQAHKVVVELPQQVLKKE